MVGSAVPAEAWWEETVGQPAEQVTRQRSSLINVVGPSDSGRLSLNVDAVRSEWRLTPAEEGLTLNDEAVNLGAFSQVSESFLDLMSRWLASRPYEMARLAFGAELLLPVKDQVSGYARLAAFLHDVTIDPKRSSDLLHQINKPRDSQIDIPNLLINRLMKWSVGSLRRVVMLPSGQVMQLPGIERYFCRLELDINTAADFVGALPSDKLPTIFQELVSLGKEISVQGDIP